LRGFVFGFRDEDEGGFVFVLGEMAVNAVVEALSLPPTNHFQKGGWGGVQSFFHFLSQSRRLA